MVDGASEKKVYGHVLREAFLFCLTVLFDPYGMTYVEILSVEVRGNMGKYFLVIESVARVHENAVFPLGYGYGLIHGMIYAAVFFGALVGDVGLVFVDNLPAVVDAASVYDKVFDREAMS